MKFFFFLCGLVLSFCATFAQPGLPYSVSRKLISKDPIITSVKASSTEDYFYLVCKTNLTEIKSITYYYYKSDSICYKVKYKADISTLNENIEDFNSKHTKIGELKWKNHKSGWIIKIQVYRKEGYFTTDCFID
jgi:hypothetical protein